MKAFNKYFDHTLLKPEATEGDIKKLCEEAKEYDFASICVNGCYVPLAASLLDGSDVKVAAVAGFPLGASSPEVKAFEANDALENGADEIDMVINVGALKDKRYSVLEDEISTLAGLCNEYRAVLKVILETCLLTDNEIMQACRLAKKSGADFVKTSTGFSSRGASVRNVQVMKKAVGDSVKIKASGGIRTLADAQAMIKAGADRLGCSASVQIMKEYMAEK